MANTGPLNHISTVLFMWKDKFEKKSSTSHWKITTLVLPRNAIMMMGHIIMQFMFYYVWGDCLKEAKISNL